MQRLDKALLVVSFGTTHEETRARTIDAIEEDLAKTFPDRRLYRGWTSRMIVKRLRDRGASVDTLEDALQRIQEDGIRDLLVQPTHMITGAENDRMMEALRGQAGGFDRILAGQPLLCTEEDRERLAKALAEELLGAGPGREAGPEAAGCQALILMGHGSANKPEANRIYEAMQETFRRLGYSNVFVATVEGKPALDDVLPALGSPDTVVLAPLMIVAGDHAKNDMAGPEEDSWKSRLEAMGLQVRPVLRGLGEYRAVREMLADHAQSAAPVR